MNDRQQIEMFADNPIFWDFDDDDDNNIENDPALERIPRRMYTYFQRISMDHWDDVDFVSRFRLRKETVAHVLQMIEHHLRYDLERFVLSLFPRSRIPSS